MIWCLLPFITEYKDYETGVKMARKAEETSAVDSDDESLKRPHNKPMRFLENDNEDADVDDEDSDDDEVDDDIDSPVEIPPPPVFKPGVSSKLYFVVVEKVFG